MKKYLLSPVLVLIALAAFSQQTREQSNSKQSRIQAVSNRYRMDEEGELYFKKQSAFGIRANSDGYGLVYEHGKFKSTRKINFLSFELSEKKHPKEERRSPESPFLGPRNVPYIYGKINNFYQFKVGYGQQRIFGGRANKNGVSVAYIYNGGISLGLLRPYVLEIADTNIRDYRKVTYDSPDSIWFTNPLFITSGPGIGDGWNKLKLRPGIHAKLGLRFDYGRFKETVTALEVGVNAEYYFQQVPQMMMLKQRQFFFNLYATLLFGGRK